jgi:hypothetical protein
MTRDTLHPAHQPYTRNLLAAALCAALPLLGACSDDVDETSDPDEPIVELEVFGEAVPVRDAVFIGDDVRFMLLLSDEEDVCQLLQEGHVSLQGGEVETRLGSSSLVSASTSPGTAGTYPIASSFVEPPFAFVELSRFDADCIQTVPEGYETSGTVVIDEVDATEGGTASVSLDVEVSANGGSFTVRESFDARFCPPPHGDPGQCRRIR